MGENALFYGRFRKYARNFVENSWLSVYSRRVTLCIGSRVIPAPVGGHGELAVRGWRVRGEAGLH